MREIKFRAWDKEKNQLMPIKMLEWSASLHSFQAMDVDDEISSRTPVKNKSLYNIIVEQYIGVKDTNGKGIYEGDIVSIQDRDGNERVIDSVIYRTDRFALKHENVRDNFLSWITNTQANYQVVIVGNIHENTELLEGE